MPPRIRLNAPTSLLSSARESICAGCGADSRQNFSSSPVAQTKLTRLRRQMWRWINSEGENYRQPLPGSTNYLGAYSNGRLRRLATPENEEGEEQQQSGDQLPPEQASDLRPFPLNPAFKSEPVLSEELREAIWEKIMREGESVEMVSAELGVEMRRVGAVVRLKEIEKEWVRQGKELAIPYSKAVLEMLPKTPYSKDAKFRRPHESINDLPVHSATRHQIWHPTSESRHFTRADAAKAFAEDLLPADDRVPHPELAELERDRLAGMPLKERMAKDQERRSQIEQERLVKEQRRLQLEEKLTTKVDNGGRWVFQFREVNVDAVGPDGRGKNAAGWRYGNPHNDRKVGQVKIPTRVE